MMLDELLVQLKQEHGDEWPQGAVNELIQAYRATSGTDETLKRRVLLMRWVQEMVAAGVAATWQPPAEVWMQNPEAQWATVNASGLIYVWENEPERRCFDWWASNGVARAIGDAPLGVDWRGAKWKRPEVQP